ncbi:ester cyclase [Chitinophaga sp. ysch24]|uniref:Ester cyclase n=2 Tax=Chitinophaga tropicalis TaxID=2683588 RepID=A0A7K1TXZ8_9BACT|nr:ester cyclase [Chitinophaga tropicalis]
MYPCDPFCLNVPMRCKSKRIDLSTQPPLSKAQRQVITTFYRTITNHDPDLLDQVVNPHWENTPLFPGQRAGPDGFKNIIRQFIFSFPDAQVSILGMYDYKGRAKVHAKMLFTQENDFMGLAPTGLKTSIILEELHTIENGKISFTYHLEDWYSLIKTTGSAAIRIPPKGKKRGRYPGKDRSII